MAANPTSTVEQADIPDRQERACPAKYCDCSRIDLASIERACPAKYCDCCGVSQDNLKRACPAKYCNCGGVSSDDNSGLFNEKSVLQTKYRPLFSKKQTKYRPLLLKIQTTI